MYHLSSGFKLRVQTGGYGVVVDGEAAEIGYSSSSCPFIGQESAFAFGFRDCHQCLLNVNISK